jgi:hypothetical protein
VYLWGRRGNPFARSLSMGRRLPQVDPAATLLYGDESVRIAIEGLAQRAMRRRRIRAFVHIQTIAQRFAAEIVAAPPGAVDDVVQARFERVRELLLHQARNISEAYMRAEELRVLDVRGFQAMAFRRNARRQLKALVAEVDADYAEARSRLIGAIADGARSRAFAPAAPSPAVTPPIARAKIDFRWTDGLPGEARDVARAIALKSETPLEPGDAFTLRQSAAYARSLAEAYLAVPPEQRQAARIGETSVDDVLIADLRRIDRSCDAILHRTTGASIGRIAEQHEFLRERFPDEPPPML